MWEWKSFVESRVAKLRKRADVGQRLSAESASEHTSSKSEFLHHKCCFRPRGLGQKAIGLWRQNYIVCSVLKWNKDTSVLPSWLAICGANRKECNYLSHTEISETNATTWHHFSDQFLLFFGMVLCTALLTVLQFKTLATDWWETFNSQSGSTKTMVLKCNTESKTEHTIWKSIRNWAEKQR